MALDRVRAYFSARGAPELCERIRVFASSTATVEEAARGFGCAPAHIAKTITFSVKPAVSAAENRRVQKVKAQQQRQQQQQQQQQKEDSQEASPTDGEAAAAAADNNDNNDKASLLSTTATAVLVVTAGDARLSDKRARAQFGNKPRMYKPAELEAAVGYPAGGVCPFAAQRGVRVYLDASLRRFATVYPACGTVNTGIPLSVDELERYTDNFAGWVDVCEGWQTTTTAAATAEAEGKEGDDEATAKENKSSSNKKAAAVVGEGVATADNKENAV